MSVEYFPHFIGHEDLPRSAVINYSKSTRTTDPEHVRVRAYFLWQKHHKDHPHLTDVQFWLLAERIERFHR